MGFFLSMSKNEKMHIDIANVCLNPDTEKTKNKKQIKDSTDNIASEENLLISK